MVAQPPAAPPLRNLRIRRASDRGATRIGWLDSRHTFSFGEYLDPEHQGFRSLRVINEDRVAPGTGFGPHPHASMEILSYVVSGRLEHRDSLGHEGVIGAGEIQYMSAGDGVVHSEANPSAEEPAHFLQIWILPDAPGGEPRHRDFDVRRGTSGGWRLLASPDGREDSAPIRQNAEVYAAACGEAASIPIPAPPGLPFGWVQVIRGAVELGGERLEDGDGASFEATAPVGLRTDADTELLLFRLA